MTPTAAIIIIGNEILSGRIEDKNSCFLAAQLRTLGVELKRIIVVPDDIDIIAADVAEQSSKCDYVFTSGGIGPTHDDVTVEAIAKAFGLRLVMEPRMAEIIKRHCGQDDTGANLKMAELPEGAELIEPERLKFPPILVKNVYIFPGIPTYLREKFLAIKERFLNTPYLIKKVYFKLEECAIAQGLGDLDKKYPTVAIGSYPILGEADYKVVVTVEGTDGAAVQRCWEELTGLFPNEYIFKS